MDDLNHLLKREQEEILRTSVSICATTRAAHEGLARGYAKRIRDHHHPYRSRLANGRRSFDIASSSPMEAGI